LLLELSQKQDRLLEKLGNPRDLEQAIEKLLDDNAALTRRIEALNREQTQAEKQRLLGAVVHKNGINCVVSNVNIAGADEAKDLAFQLKNEVENLFCVLGWETDGKPGLAVMISDELLQSHQLDASALVRDLAKHIQGGGGGQKFFATAGGKNASGLQAALDAAVGIV
jgi:alanyl-tRNA synthetase